MSISEISGASARTPVGVIAVKSRPQESQNFAVSLFWVPQREQYNPISEGTGLT